MAIVGHGAGMSAALLHCAPGPELLPWPQGHGAIGPWGYEQLWGTVRPALFNPQLVRLLPAYHRHGPVHGPLA